MSAEELNKQIQEAKKGNAILFGSNREIRRLPIYLHEGEQVYKIITGSPGKGRGVIVATDERVLFIKDGWVFRTVQDFPYETVSSVEFKTGIMFGSFIMYGKGDETAYNWVGRFAGAEFARLVRKYSSDSKRGTSAPQTASVPVQQPQIPLSHTEAVLPPVPVQQGPRERLRRIEELRDEGLINLDEYEIKKQQILSEM
jgi:hypothetical protein